MSETPTPATADALVLELDSLDQGPDLAVEDEEWTWEGEVAGLDELEARRPTCPPPTKWRFIGSASRNGRLRPASSAVTAKAAPVNYTFRVERTMSFTTTISAGFKASLRVIEADTGLSLNRTLTISTSETIAYRIPKGHTMALFGGVRYIERRFRRTVYGSAGPCYPIQQDTTVLTPVLKVLEVRDV